MIQPESSGRRREGQVETWLLEPSEPFEQTCYQFFNMT